MLCAKFGWNWPSGSGEEDFKISSMYFRYLVIISPWKRAEPFIWMNLNPFSQGCFVPSLVEIAPVALEKKMKCESLRTDNGQTLFRKAYLSLRLRWAKKKTICLACGDTRSKVPCWRNTEMACHLMLIVCRFWFFYCKTDTLRDVIKCYFNW